MDQALFHIGRSISLNPNQSKYYRCLGDVLGAAKQNHLAIFAYEKAFAINQKDTDALLNLGTLFYNQDRHQQSVDAFKRILSVAPDNIRALNNLGKVHHDMGELQIALSYYNRCIGLQPEYAEAQFNRAALLLAMGDYKNGWKAYEWRFKRSCAASVYPHRLNTPRWKGKNYRGQRLLVHCEQGMGDVLQFVRYLPMVKQRGGTLILEAHPALITLLSTHPCVDEIIVFDPQHPPTAHHDLHVPLLSLPRIFDTQTDNIPVATPYIDIEPATAEPWGKYLQRDRVNIGLFWSASDLNPKRNLPITQCRAWFQDNNRHFIALQKGADKVPADLKNELSSFTELGRKLSDFRDTASMMSHLDLMISVDTAAAHLAGALGIPLWIMLPANADWRWSPFKAACPWYPSARIFRQPRVGDWQSVIADVETALTSLL